jgi:ribonucleotide reductase beta subunit family protein with ferritin-like domain
LSVFERSKAYKPFKFPKLVEEEKKHRIDMYWHENQTDLSDDLRQYHSKEGLKTENVSHERHKLLLEKLLPLFTASDTSVSEGYAKLLPHANNNEIRGLLFTQGAREVTHYRGYALANETFGFPESSWEEFHEYKEMQDKVDLMLADVGDLSNKLNWCKQLAVVLLGEGISLFGSFCPLLNLKRSGLCVGFNDINQWSLIDEAHHISNNIYILRQAWLELSNEERDELCTFILECSQRYVDAEHRFIELIFEDGPLEDLTEAQLKGYITYLGKHWLRELGLIGSLDVPENTIEWMDWMLSGVKHDNFFEKKVTSYSHNGLQGDVDYTKYLGDELNDY